jgi:hypothetical protein
VEFVEFAEAAEVNDAKLIPSLSFVTTTLLPLRKTIFVTCIQANPYQECGTLKAFNLTNADPLSHRVHRFDICAHGSTTNHHLSIPHSALSGVGIVCLGSLMNRFRFFNCHAIRNCRIHPYIEFEMKEFRRSRKRESLLLRNGLFW